MSRQTNKQLDGILVLNKPMGPTSAQCLNTIKRSCGQKKIGHAGTLDPMATGVLVVLLGQGTKVANYLSMDRKTYRGTLTLGQTTDSYDVQGQITAEAPWEHLSMTMIEEALSQWTGVMDQEVPPVSAAKHQGKPLYLLHRTGQQVPVKTKKITIFKAQILSMNLPHISFRVTCSAGTYIRSLAHSLGKRLGCGAVLSELEREESFPFTLDHAHDLETIVAQEQQLSKLIIPLAQALPHWPKLELSADQSTLVRNGTWLPTRLFPGYPAQPGDRALMLTTTQEPVALVEAKMRDQALSWSILRGLWTT